MGRRRSDDAGVPAQRLSVGDRQLVDPSAFESFQSGVNADPRLDLKAYPERDYYEGQSETTGTLLRVFATL
jgi:hypothetical protein